jgi:hypothetical protein
MNSLIEILSHPYLVLNPIAEDLYPPVPENAEGSEALHQRLRSRVKGRHRFAVEEYKALRKGLLSLSRKLDRDAEKLRAQAAEGKGGDLRRLIQHPWLNAKELLGRLGAAQGLNYYQVYDRLRSRVKAPEGSLEALAGELSAFAAWLRERLEAAQAESRDYPFSQGRGGGSHRSQRKARAERPAPSEPEVSI